MVLQCQEGALSLDSFHYTPGSCARDHLVQGNKRQLFTGFFHRKITSLVYL